MGSLLRRSKSSCRDLICKFCAFFFGKTGIHLRINDTTGDRVDLDIARCKFFCKCFCKGIDAAFACGISNFTGGTGNAPDGRDIDDFSSLPLVKAIRIGRSTFISSRITSQSAFTLTPNPIAGASSPNSPSRLSYLPPVTIVQTLPPAYPRKLTPV